jgi:signal transduction histidine kinase/ligand-binding sensor domain-containing protein
LTPFVLSVFEDKQNNIWLGTDGNGVLLLSPGKLQFNLASIGFTRSIAEDKDYIYAGTFKNGLWKLTADLSVSERLNPLVLTNDYYFLDITIDWYDHIWTCTNEGILVMDRKGNIINNLPIKTNTARFIQNTKEKITVVVGNELLRFSVQPHPLLLSRNTFVQLRDFLDGGDRYWLGSPFGLYSLQKDIDLNTHNLSAYLHQRSKRPVKDLMINNDTLWVVGENEISCFTLNGLELQLPGCLEEIRNEVVYSLISDRYNRIWFAGNKGLGCIPADRDRLIRFNSLNNLQSLEFNSNASLISRKGNIYFGGINGINGLNPQDFNPVKQAPDVKLFSLFISDTAYSKGIPPDFLQLDLDRKAANISGSSFTTEYPYTGMQQFSYFLEGYQTQWSPFSKNSSFTYRNLPPGNYTLWVRCMDAYKNSGKPRILLCVLVRPPFWRTWWFMTISFIFILCSIVLIIRKIQEKRYQARLIGLEQQNAIEKERLRISKDMHDEIGASLTRISILSELARKNSLDPAAAIKYIDQINEISGNVVDEMSEIIWAINPKNDNLESFSSYFRQYASSYLEPTSIIVQMKFQDLLPEKGMSSELRRNVFLTLKEALHNMVKHSTTDRAEVSLNFINGLLEIRIRDFGKGFNMEDSLHKGNGLGNMHKRIEDLGGKFILESGIGMGTKIKIIVPLT